MAQSLEKEFLFDEIRRSNGYLEDRPYFTCGLEISHIRTQDTNTFVRWLKFEVGFKHEFNILQLRRRRNCTCFETRIYSHYSLTGLLRAELEKRKLRVRGLSWGCNLPDSYEKSILLHHQYLELQSGSEIDFRLFNGRFVPACIIKKNGASMTIKYTDPESNEEKCVYLLSIVRNFRRFAEYKSISERPHSERLKEAIDHPSEHEVEINPQGKCQTSNWEKGRIIESDGCQVKVRYGGGDFWVHPDSKQDVRLYVVPVSESETSDTETKEVEAVEVRPQDSLRSLKDQRDATNRTLTDLRDEFQHAESLIQEIKAVSSRLQKLTQNLNDTMSTMGVVAKEKETKLEACTRIVKQTESNLAEVQRKMQKIFSTLVDGTREWTRADFVVFLECNLAKLHSKYSASFEMWQRDKSPLNLSSVSDVALELWGVTDKDDRDAILNMIRKILAKRTLFYGNRPIGDSEKDSEKEHCVICLSSCLTVLLYPCGHKCVCESCAKILTAMKKSNRNCPLCRRGVKDTVRVFQ